MFSFLSNNIIGILEDNVGLFSGFKYPVFQTFFERLAYPFGIRASIFDTTQPLFWFPYRLVGVLFNNPIFYYNIVLLFSLLLILIFAYKFYFRIFGNKLVSGLVAINIIFSGYIQYRYKSHLELIQIWAVFIILSTLFFSANKHKWFLLGILSGMLFFVSNYLGFFNFLVIGFYFLYYFLSQLINRKVPEAKNLLLSAIKFSLPVILIVSSWFMFYKSTKTIQDTSNKNFGVSERSIEEFFYFSSRPWYYVLPSTENPIWGSYTESAISYLQDDIKYWLSFDYFPSEHSASFLGIVNLGLFLFGIYFLKTHEKKYHIDFKFLLAMLVFIFIVSMPPYVTASSIKIYLPGYLFFKIIPYFRSSARIGIFFFIVFNIFVGFGYVFLISKFKNLFLKGLIFVVVFTVFLLSLSEFVIPININKIETPPEVYSYLDSIETASFAVYPYKKSSEALFWSYSFDWYLVNPPGHVWGDIKTDELTNSLNSCSGVELLREKNVSHLVIFINEFEDRRISDCACLTLQESFINENPEKFLPDIIDKFIHYRDIGNVRRNSALLYRINSEVSCL